MKVSTEKLPNIIQGFIKNELYINPRLCCFGNGKTKEKTKCKLRQNNMLTTSIFTNSNARTTKAASIKLHPI
jgi:hypothetical protein